MTRFRLLISNSFLPAGVMKAWAAMSLWEESVGRDQLVSGVEIILQQAQHPITRVGLPIFPVNHGDAGKLRWVTDQLGLSDHLNALFCQLAVKVGVERAGRIPIKGWDGIGMRLTLRYLRLIGGQNHSQLIGIGLGLRREALANRIDVAHGSQETIGLVKEGVLPVVDVLVRRRTGIEVIGHVIERNSWFVIEPD